MLVEMSFVAGGRGTEARPRRRHSQETLGMRQSKPREIVSVGKTSAEVAVIASKETTCSTCSWAIMAVIIIGPPCLQSYVQLFMRENQTDESH